MLELTEVEQVTLTETGLVVNSALEPEMWLDLLTSATKIRGAMTWAVADLLIYAQDKSQTKPKWGETYIEGMNMTGWTYGYITNVVSTARRFPPDKRAPWPIGLSHHAAVAKLPDDVASTLLWHAYDYALNRDELRELKALNDDAETADDVVLKRDYTDYQQLILPLETAAQNAVQAWQSGKKELIDQAMRELEMSLDGKSIHSQT